MKRCFERRNGGCNFKAGACAFGLRLPAHSAVRNLKVGDQVLVPFNVFCGSCFFCQRELYSNCHNVNAESSATGAIYGYSHTMALHIKKMTD